jgi:hypothetical protein
MYDHNIYLRVEATDRRRDFSLPTKTEVGTKLILAAAAIGESAHKDTREEKRREGVSVQNRSILSTTPSNTPHLSFEGVCENKYRTTISQSNAALTGRSAT